MKFGAMVVPRASDWRLFAELEQMGCDSAWVPDSQMIYSDTYARAGAGRCQHLAHPARARRCPDAQETAALRDFNVAYVGCGSMLLKKDFEGGLLAILIQDKRWRRKLDPKSRLR
jgi:hypothetical protein